MAEGEVILQQPWGEMHPREYGPCPGGGPCCGGGGTHEAGQKEITLDKRGGPYQLSKKGKLELVCIFLPSQI